MTSSTFERAGGNGEMDSFPPLESDSLPKLLKLRTEQYGDSRVFMLKKQFGIWQRFTWQKVYEQVKDFALGLASLGLERGDTIAIIGENQPEQFWAEYAVQALGGRAVCLYPDMTSSEVQYIVDNSDAIFLVAEDQEQVDKALEIKDKLPRLRRIIYWDSQGMWHYHDPILLPFQEVQAMGREFGEGHPGFFENEIELGKGHDIAALCYTSGTTGLPKGVMASYANIFDVAYRVLMALQPKPFSEYLSFITPASAWEQWMGICLGLILPMVINFPEKPETIQENIREIGVEVLTLGPRQWESLAAMVQARMLDAGWLRRMALEFGLRVGREVNINRLEGRKASPLWSALYPFANLLVLRPLRDRLGLSKSIVTMTAGTAMAPDVFRFFHTIGVKLRNTYGMSEKGMFTIHQGEQFDLETAGKWYRTHPNFGPPLEWKLSEQGELLVRGGSSFVGYYKNPEATAGKLVDGWFATGDAVAVNENGDLVYLERLSDMRELATGYRFPPQYIETRLRFSPYIKDAMTLGDKDKDFVAALINIDPETCGRWAEQYGIAYSTFSDLSQKAELRQLIASEIARVNKTLSNESRIKRFVNLSKEFDPDEAELTRSRKLRRTFLENRFKDLITAIYEGRQELVTEVPVKYRDGRVGLMKTATVINTLE